MGIRGFPYLIGRDPMRGLLLLFGLTAAGCAATGPGHSVATTPPAPGVERSATQAATVPAPGVHHVVGRGQTLWRIAKVYGVDLADLAAANGITDTSVLETGRSLFIPGAERVLDVPAYPAPLESAQARALPSSPDVVPGQGWSWPIEHGVVISSFGAPRRNHRHEGIDIRGRSGQDVHAARAGRVSFSGSGMRGYGKTIIIEHGDGLETLYAHNSVLLVGVGERVERGQVIARVGRTGNASGEHCHFEIRNHDDPVDPMPYLGGVTTVERR
jgi:murein DD-endopeptidase MepM/ murein hydrolase activator NlpD